MSSCVVLVIYRPGSSAVTTSFFSELSDVLDRFSTYVEPLVLAGDVNIRLERSADPHAVEFGDLLASYGLDQCVQDVTYDRSGMLDVVCTRGDLPAPKVAVRDVGFSDHRLLRWVSPFQRPSPVYMTEHRRSWRSFCFGHVPSRPADVSVV